MSNKAEENRGYKVEERLRKFFKGVTISCDEVDFETSTSLYEVKSCKIFNRSYNSNHLRKYKVKPHKKIETHQLGRFWIKTDNHIALYLKALQVNKAAKYIFVIRFGNQIIFRIIPWSDIKIINDKDYHYIAISDIFYEKKEIDGEAAQI